MEPGNRNEELEGQAVETAESSTSKDPIELTPPGLGEKIGTVISTPTSPTFFEIEFRIRPGKTTRPGKIVAVYAKTDDGRTSYILCRVNDAHEVNPHQDALSATLEEVLPFETRYADEGSSTVIYRAASTEPLEEALIGPRGEIIEVRAVETLARAGAPIFEVGPELTIAAFGLEPDPNKGLHMGNIHGAPDTPVTLAKEIIQRHIFIGGGIGSGKSYTRGVLAEELHALGVPQINIDVNGEMVEATEELEGVNVVPGKGGFTVPVSALSSNDVLQAIPSINRGTNIETLVGFAHETLLKQVMEGKRAYFTIDDLAKQIAPSAVILNFTQTAQTVKPAELRTESLKRIKFLGEPYDWQAKLKPGAIINIDCRGLFVSELRLIAASVMRDIQRLAKDKKIPFTVLSIDEFHLIAPSQEDTVTTQVLREIARIGRHYRLGLILTTQSPADVDRSVLKRLLTRFLHAIEPDQLDALRGVFSDASEELVKTLPKLPQGVCIVTGAMETVRHAAVVKIRTRKTTHGGKTPDVFADLATRGWKEKKAL